MIKNLLRCNGLKWMGPMFFTPESITHKRRELLTQFDAGELTHEQTFQRALELDPLDALALSELARGHLQAGDLAGAAEYAWRSTEANPYHSLPWFVLYQCLPQENHPLRKGILELALSKSMREGDRIEEITQRLEQHPELSGIPGAEVLEAILANAADARTNEPAEVSARLQPHRLIDEMLDAGEGLAFELVDSIVENGARCAPLLCGVLSAFGSGLAGSHDVAPPVASLALLGEIGDPARLPELIECSSADDDHISHAADWAGFRIVSRRPEESLAVLRKMIPAAPAIERSAIASLLAGIPDIGRQMELFDDLLDGLAAFSKDDRQELFFNVTASMMLAAGGIGRERAWSLFRRYQNVLPKRSRSELQDATTTSKEMSAAGIDFNREFQETTVYDLCSGLDDEEEEGEEEEHHADDHAPPVPVHRPGDRGRNDPCWCGSGKKYKKCHLAADEAAPRTGTSAAEALPAAAADDSEARLRRRLIDFSNDTLGEGGMEKSLLAFIGNQAPAGSDEQSLAMEALDWMIHDYVPPRLGHTMIEEFVKRNPDLTPREREMLDAWSRARFSMLEVREVEPGAGVHVTDLLAGGEFFVHDVSTAKHANRWDCQLARVEKLDGEYHFTAVVMTLPRHLVADLKEWAIEERLRTGLPWDRFLHANSARLRQEASRLIDENRLQRVTSVEGDEFVFSKAHFEIVDEAALRQALDRSPVMIRENSGDYGWVDEKEDQTGGRRAFGHLAIANGELTIECQTRQRLERGKDLLRQLAGAALRHKADDFRGWKSALRDYQASGAKPPGSGVPPEVEREIVEKMTDEHYRTWPDTPLPYLGGKTPRQAMATPKGRAQVIELLKMFENGEDRSRREGRASFDVSKLKRELGVEY
jgi:hypothetical protein